jgi:hypothetical protein
MVVFHWFKVWVFHRVTRGHTLCVVISEHFAQQIHSFFGNKLLVLRIDELLPWLARLLAQ